MISPDEIAHYRARLDQGAPMPYERAVRLLDEIERLRGVIRETHSRCIEGRLCERTCKLHEIEP